MHYLFIHNQAIHDWQMKFILFHNRSWDDDFTILYKIFPMGYLEWSRLLIATIFWVYYLKK